MDPNNLNLSPGDWVVWIIVGLIAGFLARHFVRDGGGLGLIGDLIVGLVGAVIGGFVLGFFAHGTFGLLDTILIAFVGAAALLLIERKVTGGRRKRPHIR